MFLMRMEGFLQVRVYKQKILRTSPIKAIKLDGGGGSAYARMTGIEVDGEVLIDAHGLVLAVPFVGSTDDASHLVNSSQSQ